MKDIDSNNIEQHYTGTCFLCGECCQRYNVRLSLLEAVSICDTLGLEWEEFHERYLDKRWPGSSSFLVRHNEHGCVFLKRSPGEKAATCFIHNFKPSACVEWQPGLFKKECRDGLKRAWKLEVGEGGTIKGKSEALKSFNEFNKKSNTINLK